MHFSKMNQKKVKQYKELNLKGKVELINFLETNSERKTAEKFCVSKTTVNNIKKRKSEYFSRYENECASLKRKFKSTQYENINNAVSLWFKKMRSINARVSGDMIKEVALQYGAKYSKPEFKASNGWLQKFCVRNNISYKTLTGESNEVSEETVELFKTNFSEFSRGFIARDVFNADECGLFFKAMPNKSYVFKGESCKSGKMVKERLTILLCTSAMGEKLKPVVIGKAKRPHALRNLKIENLPVIWRYNTKAWMTSAIFEEWLNMINLKMKRQNRHILMTVDNFPAHPRMENMSNVTLKFLPPNTTSVIQPLDQGIIKNFKHYYRSYLVKSIVAETIIADVSEFTKKINVLDAIQWMSLAWDRVGSQTIANCFKKAGFDFNMDRHNDSAQSDDEIIIQESSNLVPYNNDDYLSIDDNLCVCEEPQQDTIFQSVIDELNNSTQITSIVCTSESDEDDENIKEIEKLPTQKEVNSMLHALKKYSSEKCPAMFGPVSNAETIFQDFIATKPKIQMTLDAYLSAAS